MFEADSKIVTTPLRLTEESVATSDTSDYEKSVMILRRSPFNGARFRVRFILMFFILSSIFLVVFIKNWSLQIKISNQGDTYDGRQKLEVTRVIMKVAPLS